MQPPGPGPHLADIASPLDLSQTGPTYPQLTGELFLVLKEPSFLAGRGFQQALVPTLWKHQVEMGSPAGQGLEPHACSYGQESVVPEGLDVASIPSVRASPWGPDVLLAHSGRVPRG